MKMVRLILILFLPLYCIGAVAQDEPSGFDGMNSRIQKIKGDIVDLDSDIKVLEDQFLYPSSSKINVFLSMDVGNLFNLDSVKVKIDNELVASHIYSKSEKLALKKGGVHQIYTGNLRPGKHELLAVFTGQGPKERDYRRGLNHFFTKETNPTYIELQIFDSVDKRQPEFSVKQW